MMLDDEQYDITQIGKFESREKAKFYNHFEKGKYTCLVCDAELFDSKDKFKDYLGWTTFSYATKNIIEVTEPTMLPVEDAVVRCRDCGSYVGYVFYNPPQWWERLLYMKKYRVNSIALKFVPEPPESGLEPKKNFYDKINNFKYFN